MPPKNSVTKKTSAAKAPRKVGAPAKMSTGSVSAAPKAKRVDTQSSINKHLRTAMNPRVVKDLATSAGHLGNTSDLIVEPMQQYIRAYVTHTLKVALLSMRGKNLRTLGVDDMAKGLEDERRGVLGTVGN